MDRNRVLKFGAGGAIGVVAIAAAAFALAPQHGLAAMDANHDGQIVNAEIQQAARERFAELDADRDGRLVGDELPRGGHGRGHGHHGDREHDGFGDSKGEALATTTPRSDPATAATAAQPQAIRRGLAAADRDGDGALTLREFYAGMLVRTARADGNADGTISAEELAAHHPGGGRHGR